MAVRERDVVRTAADLAQVGPAVAAMRLGRPGRRSGSGAGSE